MKQEEDYVIKVEIVTAPLIWLLKKSTIAKNTLPNW